MLQKVSKGMLCLFTIAALLLALVGCGGQNTIEGTVTAVGDGTITIQTADALLTFSTLTLKALSPDVLPGAKVLLVYQGKMKHYNASKVKLLSVALMQAAEATPEPEVPEEERTYTVTGTVENATEAAFELEAVDGSQYSFPITADLEINTTSGTVQDGLTVTVTFRTDRTAGNVAVRVEESGVVAEPGAGDGADADDTTNGAISDAGDGMLFVSGAVDSVSGNDFSVKAGEDGTQIIKFTLNDATIIGVEGGVLQQGMDVIVVFRGTVQDNTDATNCMVVSVQQP